MHAWNRTLSVAPRCFPINTPRSRLSAMAVATSLTNMANTRKSDRRGSASSSPTIQWRRQIWQWRQRRARLDHLQATLDVRFIDFKFVYNWNEICLISFQFLQKKLNEIVLRAQQGQTAQRTWEALLTKVNWYTKMIRRIQKPNMASNL
jgi:hypothetical protein